ncbi:MAG TPA: Gfo/Idh/MocA family oxidoreductase [Flavitalea sp.]|nr:Gfo/Idh/MocA family oxidoreductase [Flavitalea sp.]
MKQRNNRRTFLKNTALAGFGLGLAGTARSMGLAAQPGSVYPAPGQIMASGRVGIIGLDTSHSPAFTKFINASDSGFKVTIAYPYGSRDIESSASRIPGITETIKGLGIEIAGSIAELLEKCDVVLLETNDGRLHLEQALEVMKAGKRLFIDKPIAASLADAIAIFDASKKYNVPVFSCSSLRFNPGVQDMARGVKVGKIMGVDSYSPCSLEKTHPDLFWYGIHGVEVLFTLMGKGCKKVVRVNAPDADVAVGTWEGDRIGTFRGTRGKVAHSYGGSVFGEKAIAPIPPFKGYDDLVVKILEFFKTGTPPVDPEETLEICAFMEAADQSKKKGGVPVSIQTMFIKARKKRK